jgi:hypothetical protein
LTSDSAHVGESVRIPKDPVARAKLAQMAGLTDEERLAIDQWCAEQAREDDARRRRGLEKHGNDVMAAEGFDGGTDG